MPAKIAIIGSCVSQDWLHFKDPMAEWPFEPTPMRQHSSFPSLFAAPAVAPAILAGRLSDWEERQLRGDIEKGFLRQLEEAKPAVLIVDFAVDSLCGLIRYGHSWITYGYMLRLSSLFPAVDGNARISPQFHISRYLAALKVAARAFDHFAKSSLPGCRILLHKCRFAERKIGRDGTVTPFEPRLMQAYRVGNVAIRLLEETFQQEVTCEVISLGDTAWLADESHIWGSGGMHLERGYYRRFNTEFARMLAHWQLTGHRTDPAAARP